MPLESSRNNPQSEDKAILTQQSSRKDLIPRIYDNARDVTLVLDFLWAWLNGYYSVMSSSSRHLMYNSLVNTRCIFYRIRANRADPDNFTLCPVLDFANHNHNRADIHPVIDSEGWGVVARKPPKYFVFFGPSQNGLCRGQELYLQYGSHSNNLLFSEYGFINQIPEGAIKDDEYPGQVEVDELVEQLFAEKGLPGTRMKSALENEGYWGYVAINEGKDRGH